MKKTLLKMQAFIQQKCCSLASWAERRATEVNEGIHDRWGVNPAMVPAEPGSREATLQAFPLYCCTKKVRAVQIAKVTHTGTTDGAALTPEHPKYSTIMVSPTYMAKHKPVPGGFFVLYEDGYESFSPSASFIPGYHRI